MPFLTLEDPNAKIKGSRDPLGAQPIWAAFGRHVVRNLTTQSTSVRGFTTLLLARYFAAELVAEGRASREDALDVFLRMEQLGAYVQHVAHGVEGDIRGIERVRRSVHENKGRVPIQANRRGMILSDQKVYGLWGLYSVPARRSDLIPEGPLDVTPEAREFIERHYLTNLNGAGPPLRQLLARGGMLRTHQKDAIFSALAKILKPKFSADELDFYGRHLRDDLEVDGGDGERQATFRRLLESETKLEEPVDRTEMLHLAKLAEKKDEGLATSLERIVHLEAVLAPAAALFQHVLARHGQKLQDVGHEVARQWGKRVPYLDGKAFATLTDEIRGQSNPAIATEMSRCHAALHAGDYVEAMKALLKWNELVMQTRGAAPWARVGDQKRLDVRYRGNEQLLPKANELRQLWDNSYFINALKSVTLQLKH